MIRWLGITFIILASVALTLSFSLLNNSEVIEDPTEGCFVDSRDNTTYRWVKIGSQIWMAENLRFKDVSGCIEFRNKKNYTKNQGYLYTWESAQKAVPEGWHIPSDEEYAEMFKYIAGDGANSRIIHDSLEQDKYGFNLETNGSYDAGRDKFFKPFCWVASAKYWSSSFGLSMKKDTLYSYFIYEPHYHRTGIVSTFDKLDAMHVRCVKNPD